MVDAIDVEWSLFQADDPWSPLVNRATTRALRLADMPDYVGETCQELVNSWINHDVWVREWGVDEIITTVLMQIHQPEPVAGFYYVDIERTFRPRMVRTLPKDPRDGQKR